jgi:hypothetical protein
VERANLSDAPNVLTQKFPAPCFRADTAAELRTTAEGDEAGFIVYGDDYRSVAVKKTAGAYAIVLYDGAVRCDPYGRIDPSRKHEREEILETVKTGKADFRLSVGRGAVCRLGGGEFKAAGGSFAARPGIWVGAKVGIYCVGRANARSEGCAEFTFFGISP